MIHYLPLTLDQNYLSQCIAYARQRGAALHLSHQLCHNADDLLRNAAQAQAVAAVVAEAQGAGVPVWCWTHEYVQPPAEFVDDQGRLRCDDPGLGEHLRKKYTHFCQEVVPGLSGLVLTFAECPYPVYQSARVHSQHSPAQRTRLLIDHLYAALRPQGLRLAVRDFVYRVDEVQAMAEALDGLPEDIIIMSKAVPHDWHPDYPMNPLMGAFPRHQQWAEHDLGFEYEGQHLLPYANVDTIAGRMQAERQRGVAAWCLRLDRFAGERGATALSSPWGQAALAVAEAAARGEDVPQALEAWQQQHFAGAAAWLREATDCLRQVVFPRGQWYANHSNLPTYGYARSHLSGGNAHRLAAWSKHPADHYNEQAMASMPPGWAAQMMAEGAAQAQRAEDLQAHLQHLGELGPAAGQWQQGAQLLVIWAQLFAAHRRAYFAIREEDQRPGSHQERALQAAIDELEALGVRYQAQAVELRLEGRRPDTRPTTKYDRAEQLPPVAAPAAWSTVVASLRAAAARACAAGAKGGE